MKPRFTLTLGNFFSAAFFFLIIYIITPYLSAFMPASETGLVISVGAVATLIAFPLMPQLVRRHGPRKLAIWFAAIELFALSWLALFPAAVPAIIFVAIAFAVAPLVSYQLDLLLEATVAQEGTTGRIRTLFISAGNIAVVLAPLVAGMLLGSSDAYWRVFAVAAVSLIPFFVLMSVGKLPAVHAPNLVNMTQAYISIVKDSDRRSVLLAQVALQIFYRALPLYLPLYLHNALGIPWQYLGWMLAAMLVPIIFIEYPAGWLADLKLGDRTLMLIGFVIMTLSVMSLAFITKDTTFLVIIIVLVANGCGAALVESMSEGHFFRRVNEQDAAMVSLFRMTRPGAALIGPLVGSVILSIAGYQTLFIFAGLAIGAIGLPSAAAIKDMRSPRSVAT